MLVITDTVLNPNLEPRVPKIEYSRRHFVMNFRYPRFAAALVPVNAQTITTDISSHKAGGPTCWSESPTMPVSACWFDIGSRAQSDLDNFYQLAP